MTYSHPHCYILFDSGADPLVRAGPPGPRSPDAELEARSGGDENCGKRWEREIWCEF
jgi:hypothetical protein